MSSFPEDFPGTARFQVIRQLGHGGMGVVYEVLDTATNEKVALKTLRALTPDSLLRFKQEFRVLQDIEHQHLISLLELIADDEAGWFFTMELVDGPTFLEHVRRKPSGSMAPDAPTVEVPTILKTIPRDEQIRRRELGQVDENLLRTSMAQLVRGLMALHAAGKIHRDIKPSNVLVDTSDGGTRVVILDFGLAVEHAREPQINAMSSPEAEPQTIVGTVDYMSPEQAASQPLGPESDWYSVGVMLFEALTGDVPFTGGPIDVLFAKQRGEARTARSVNPNVPADLDALCADLLRFSPSARPGGVEILDRLGGRAVAERSSTISSGGIRNFVGRDEELERLHAAFEDARLGRGGSVYVMGESGVGKSALVRRFLDEARAKAHDLVLLTGRCYERESVPYKAMDGVIDALSHYLVKAAGNDVSALLPTNAPLLAEVFPVLSRVPAVVEAPVPPHQVIDPIERRNRVFGALRELFGRLAKKHPVLVVIDDLQWSDDDSRALLAELLRQPDAPPILLVATLRPIDTTSQGSPLAGLPDPVDRIDLDKLPFEQALVLAEQIARTVAPDAKLPLPQLVEEAGGHPLFLDELIRFSATTQASTTRPVQLEDALRARIESLEPESRQLLSLIALAGRPILQITAAQATALGAGFPKQIGVLRVAHLLRTNGMRGTDRVETFHDRVRSAALAGIAPEMRPELHRRLAVAFETSGQVDPEAQMMHWGEAGDRAKSANYARLAAAQAARALAFERAARLYQQCIELSPSDATALRELRISLGDSLINAGRSAEAADEYLRAAELSSSAEALDLNRRAAEALLRSGRVNKGLEVVGKVLAAVDMDIASTPTRALMSIAYRRARLRLRGLKFKPRELADISPNDLTRIDVCWSVGTGLAFVDVIRGADFQTRNLLLALEAGEPDRIARAMCLEAMYSAIGGRSSGKRTDMLLAAAQAQADKVGEPRLLGLHQMATGTCRFLEGNFRHARDTLVVAESIFRDRCSGVFWELASTYPFLLFAQYFIGELRDLMRRVPLLVVGAQDRGDLYSLTNLRVEFVPMVALFNDQPDVASESVREGMSAWTNEGVHLEHFWEMHASAQIALYRGDPEAAYEAVVAIWSKLKAALLLGTEQIRVECLYLRGRSALAAARVNPTRRAALLDAGIRDAKQLLGEKAAWAQPLGHVLKSSWAALKGDTVSARNDLALAIPKLESLNMKLHAMTATARHGALVGGDEGAALLDTANAWFRAEQVARPERVIDMLAPPASLS